VDSITQHQWAVLANIGEQDDSQSLHVGK